MVRPGNDFLFAGSSTTGGIYAYAISSTGALTAENTGDAVASVFPVAMDIDAAGSYLVALLNDYSTVVTYAINTSTGALTLTNSATATTGSLNGGVKILPDEDYAYVSTGTGGISIFTFDSSTGAIVNTGSHLAGSSTVSYHQVAVDTTSTYLAAVRVGTDSGVDEHTLSSGTIESGTVYTTGGIPSAVAFGPSNEAVYVTNRNENTVAEFTFSAGTLTALSTSTIATGSVPIAVLMDSSSTNLLVLNNGGSPAINIYTFSSTTTGELVSAGSLSSTGTDPVAMAVTH